MDGFLYFVPGRAQPTRDSLAKLSPPYGFPHASLAKVPGMHTAQGPGGLEGYVFALDETNAIFRAEAQVWSEAAGGAFWVGYNKSSPPGPASLARDHALSGTPIKLHDGHFWRVPALIDSSDLTPAVDCVVRMSPSGELVKGEVHPRYARPYGLARKLWDAMAASGADPIEVFSAEDTFLLCCDALAVNYRVSQWEVSALGLLVQGGIPAIVAAALGLADGTQGRRGEGT